MTATFKVDYLQKQSLGASTDPPLARLQHPLLESTDKMQIQQVGLIPMPTLKYGLEADTFAENSNACFAHHVLIIPLD